ncbi:MAG: hypothetical protein C0501_03730 [Isosphaera sp.]|nr:hypothetical protein [Isosphaera sp.]
MPAGTILTVIGPKVTVDGKSWYPVVPPAGDVRYVPKAAVTADKAVNTSVTVRDTVPAVAAEFRPPASRERERPEERAPVAHAPGSPVRTAPAVDHPLWAQAEAAEKDGRLDDAEKLLFQLAKEMNAPGGDHDVANRCYTRIHTLREKKRGPAAPPPDRPLPRPEQRGTPVADRSGWNGPGRLVRSALAIDGRKTYALEPNPGVPVVYVVAGPGVDLERFVNRRVTVQGASQSHRDVSRPYVVATGVEPAP